MVSVDLMFVDDRTWERLSAEPLERDVAGHPILIPRPEHMIALKLRSAWPLAMTKGEPQTLWKIAPD